MRTRITPNTDTFHAVLIKYEISDAEFLLSLKRINLHKQAKQIAKSRKFIFLEIKSRKTM